MKHRVGFNRLGRKSSHRKAMRRNMVTSLFKYEKVTTTKAKALEIKRAAEKMITRAKVDSLHNRREIARAIEDKAILAKLFLDIAPRFSARPGGYTRVIKIGQRKGDAAELVILELVEKKVNEKKGKESANKAEVKTEPKEKAAVKAKTSEKAEVKTETKEKAAVKAKTSEKAEAKEGSEAKTKTKSEEKPDISSVSEEKA